MQLLSLRPCGCRQDPLQATKIVQAIVFNANYRLTPAFITRRGLPAVGQIDISGDIANLSTNPKTLCGGTAGRFLSTPSQFSGVNLCSVNSSVTWPRAGTLNATYTGDKCNKAITQKPIDETTQPISLIKTIIRFRYNNNNNPTPILPPPSPGAVFFCQYKSRDNLIAAYLQRRKNYPNPP